jgi:hypothetical protein
MKKFALIVLAGASLLGTGIASAQYSFGDEGYWQRRGRVYGLPCDNTRWCAQYSGGRVAVPPIAASSPLSSVEKP